MATNYGTSIVTSGLVFYADAGNVKSYPGSGTVVTDLTGNGYTGTLVNSPTHTAGASGYWTFNGTSSVINFPGINLAATPFTVFGIARYNGLGANARGRIITAYVNNWLMGHWGASTENYYSEGWVSATSAGTNDNAWRIYHATGNISLDQYQIYVNGVSTAGPNTGGAAGPNGISLGAMGNSGAYTEYSNGDCACVGAYNRVLTSAEILQNFNALRTRYGL
jgi:hypothetical protein